MKKALYVILPTIILLMLAGCKKEKSCGPCGCDNDGYASAGDTVSWADYNTPEAFNHFFYPCHWRTAQENNNRIIKLKGYPIPNANGSYLFDFGNLGTGICLCDDKTGVGESMNTLIYNDTSFTNHIDDYLEHELFFTGKTHFSQLHPPSGYNYLVFIWNSRLDSIGPLQ